MTIFQFFVPGMEFLYDNHTYINPMDTFFDSDMKKIQQ